MSNQQQQVQHEPATPMNFLRPLLALAAVVVAAVLTATAWDKTGAATDATSWRIFLVGWVVAVVTMAAGFALVSISSRSAPPLAVQHFTIGLVFGLAIGTTDWTTLSFVGWWQFWWTVPLLLAYAGHLMTLQRSSSARL